MPTETFGATGSEQTWTVPDGVSSVTIECLGAGDGTGESFGGYATGQLAVNPGDTLYLYVGTAGGDNTPGWPNGGDASNVSISSPTYVSSDAARGGGGSSDVRYGGSTTSDIVILAGGGGGRGDADDKYSKGTWYHGEDGGGSTSSSDDSGSFNGGDGETGTDGHNTTAGGGGGGGLNGGIGGTVSAYNAIANGGGGGDGSIAGVSNGSMTTGGGNSGDGEIVIFYTTPPSNLSADTVRFRSIDLSWAPVDNAESYNIYRGGSQIDSVSPGTTTYTDDGLSPTTQYEYYVTVVVDGTESGPSKKITPTTGGDAPTNVSAAAGAVGELDITWDDTNDDEDGYEIHLATSSGVDTSGTPAKTTSANATSATVSGLKDGEKYYLQVVAIRNDERGNDSAEANGTTVLPAPTFLSTSNIQPTSADLSWTNNHNYGSVTVQYKRSSNSSWQDWATDLSLLTESETLTGLLNGEEYDVRVLAVTEHTQTEGT